MSCQVEVLSLFLVVFATSLATVVMGAAVVRWVTAVVHWMTRR